MGMVMSSGGDRAVFKAMDGGSSVGEGEVISTHTDTATFEGGAYLWAWL